MKSLIIFDLDGTLAESKSPLDEEMASLLTRLVTVAQVAVISGGAWDQFQKQVLARLPDDSRMNRLSMLPVCGTRFYRRQDGSHGKGGHWSLVYSEDFRPAEKKRIMEALDKALDQSGFRPARHWGAVIEDRGGQITMSALGQDAPLSEKQTWDPDFRKRQHIMELLRPLLPDVSIKTGGSTSIDITHDGVDKAHGILKLKEILGLEITDMLFLGDALFPGGNDSPVKRTGVETIEVRDPKETKRVVAAIIACLTPAG